MTKEEIINYLYYLWDKIDPVYMKEVNPSIIKFIECIKKNF